MINLVFLDLFIISIISIIAIRDFFKFNKSLGLTLSKASLFNTASISQIIFNLELISLNNTLSFIILSIKSCLSFILSISFKGFSIFCLKTLFHIGEFVLFKTQNKVHRVWEFVE